MELKQDRRRLNSYGEAPPIKEQRQSMMTDQNTVTPQVKRELMELDKTVQEIEKQITALEDRLAAVLLAHPPLNPERTKEVQEEECLVPMAEGVREVTTMAKDISNRIHSIMQRVQI